MTPMPAKRHRFWVAALGRSGTHTIRRLLAAQGPGTVMHEDADSRTPAVAHGFSPFPIERFLGDEEVYGEVHGFLRYHLSPGFEGHERLVEHRAIIYRPLRKVILAWMNRGLTAGELSSVIYEVSWQWQNLELYSRTDPGCPVFLLEEVMTSEQRQCEFIRHLGFDDPPLFYDFVENPTPDSIRRFEWDRDMETIFQRVNARLWKPLGKESRYLDHE